MSLLSLAHLLLDRPMQKRFESDPLFQATMLLLQERIPRATAFYLETPELADIRATSSGTEMPVRVFSSPNTPIPEVQLLPTADTTCVTNAGGGYSRWKDISVTRWREDTTCDTGARSVTSAMWRAGSSGQPPISLRSNGLTHTKLFSPEGRRSFAAATSTMIRIQRSLSRRRMTSNCAGPVSRTPPGHAERST